MTVPADAIRALIDERERYEGWLAALAARRGATPAHVYDRVHADYDARLRGVQDRLSEQVVPLRETEVTLAQRQDEVVRTLTERQDELAELELRTLVGEFEAGDGERRVQETAAVVRELDAERRSVSEQLTELRALLMRAGSGAATPGDATPGGDAASHEGARGGGEASSVAPFAGGAAAATVAPTVDAPAAATSHDAPTPWQGSGPVDDEGFVGTGPRLDSLAASLGGAVAPVAPAASGSQERTLRCQECGEMNFPTEWYCERCGGELAAL